MRRESSWANHGMRGCWGSSAWPKADLAAFGILILLSIFFFFFFFFFLTLVHHFLPLFFLLESVCVREREMRRGWVELRIWCWEISPTRADMWAMSHSEWQLTSHSICCLCMFIGWSNTRNGSSDSFWICLPQLRNLISWLLNPFEACGDLLVLLSR